MPRSGNSRLLDESGTATQHGRSQKDEPLQEGDLYITDQAIKDPKIVEVGNLEIAVVKRMKKDPNLWYCTVHDRSPWVGSGGVKLSDGQYCYAVMAFGSTQSILRAD